MVQMPAPRSAGSPYIPVITYTTDWPTVMTIPNTGGNEEDTHNITKVILYMLRGSFGSKHIKFTH